MNALAPLNLTHHSVGAVDRPAPGGVTGRAPKIGAGLPALFDLPLPDRHDPARIAVRRSTPLRLAWRQDDDLGPDLHDLRDHTTKTLQQRFGVDPAQATRVRRTAQSLHTQLSPQADPEQQRELGWSADLHEIGMVVSHHGHHHHSAYLLEHVDAAGFSRAQQHRVTQLVLGQRGGLRKSHDLCSDRARVVQLLALRLAVLLCQPRIDPPQGLQVALATRPKARTLTLRWPASWAVELQQTVHLLDKEAVNWAGLADVEVSTGALK